MHQESATIRREFCFCSMVTFFVATGWLPSCRYKVWSLQLFTFFESINIQCSTVFNSPTKCIFMSKFPFCSCVKFHKLIKETITCFSYEKFFVTIANGSFQSHHKKVFVFVCFGFVFVLFFCHYFDDRSNVHLMDSDDRRLNDIWPFNWIQFFYYYLFPLYI